MTTPASNLLHPEHPVAEDGNPEFNKLVEETNKEQHAAIADDKASPEAYFAEQEKLDKKLRDELQKLGRDAMSEEQKREFDALDKHVNYNDRNSRIAEDYAKNPNDPAAKAAHDKMEKDFKDFRGELENDELFKDNAHIKNMKSLDEQLDHAKTDEERKSIHHEIAVEARAWMREEEARPDGKDRFVSFAERHKDNAVVQQSGMLDQARNIEEHEAKHQLNHGEVTPDGPAQAGGVVKVSYKDEKGEDVTVTKDAKTGELIAHDKDNHLEKAGTMVTATQDNGQGRHQTQQYKVENANGVMVPQTQNANANSNQTTR